MESESFATSASIVTHKLHRSSVFTTVIRTSTQDAQQRRGLRVDHITKKTNEIKPVTESHITVARTSPQDAQDRHVIVTLDDKEFATLKYGASATQAIAPGRHSLGIANTWNTATIAFDLAPGEHAKFITINRAGRMTWVLGALGGGPLYCSIEREK